MLKICRKSAGGLGNNGMKKQPAGDKPTDCRRRCAILFRANRAARRPDAARESPPGSFIFRKGLVCTAGKMGWLFAEELSKQTDYRFYQLNNQFERCGQNTGKKIYNAMEKGCKLSEK